MEILSAPRSTIYLKLCHSPCILLLWVVLFTTSTAQGATGVTESTVAKLQEDEFHQRYTTDFVFYLLSSANPSLVYVVCDHHTNYLASPLAFQLTTSSATVVLLRLDSSQELERIHEFLGQKLNNVLEKHVVLLISPESILDLFQKVRQKALEAAGLRWYIPSQNKEFLKPLEALLREGTWVVVGIRQQRDDLSSDHQNRIDIFSTRIDMNGTVHFERIGYWSPFVSTQPKVRGGGALLLQPVFPDMMEYYRDFRGRHLKSAGVDFPPLSPLKVLPDGRLRNEGGLDGNILTILSTKFNFTYDAMKSPAWGGPQPDGTVTGIVGMVARREADVAINTLTITPQRAVVVDFTNPYTIGAACVVSRAPAEKNRALAILRPFTLPVWLSLVAAVSCAGLIVLLVTAAAQGVAPDPTDSPLLKVDQVLWYSFNQFRSLVIQGNLIQPSRMAPRIVTLAWYFFCLNIYIVYSGSLTSFLTLPSFEKPIDSLLDLYNFLQERDIQFMFLEDTTYEYMFTYAHADSGIYAKLGAMAKEESYTPEEELTIRRIRNGEDIAYVSDYFTVQITTSLLGKARFHIARQTFSPQPFAITLYNGCPYVANFNKQLLRLQEFGLPDKWLKDAIKRAEFQGWKNNRGNINDSRGLLPSLSLKHLQSALILFAVGMLLAFLVFLVELCSAAMSPRISSY